MNWYAVRSVYHFGMSESGENIFEERIVCFIASNFDDAHKKGKAESLEYASENGFEVHPEQLIYKQDGKELIDGYEVWSDLYQSSLDLALFYKERYLKYIYAP